MKPMTSRQKLAQVHSALGHARRLRILELLEKNPDGMVFEELERRLKIHGSTLGHHMRCLMQAGFLDKTIKGPYSIYRYDPTPLFLIFGSAPLLHAA